MTNKQFAKLIREFRKQQDRLVKLKGHDYTMGKSDEDRLLNFKWVANLLGLEPMQVLAVYWLKHILAILTFIKHKKIKSESLASRFLDENNYNLLGWALIQEQLHNHKWHKKQRRSWKKKRPPSVRK